MIRRDYYVENLRVKATNLRVSTPKTKFGRADLWMILGFYRVPGLKKKFRAVHLGDSRKQAYRPRREKLSTKQNRIAICSAKRERKGEREKRCGARIWRKGGEKRSINCFTLCPFLSPFSPRAFGTRLKNPLNLWPRRKRPCICLRFRHQSRVLVATGARELHSAIYRSRPGSPTGPILYLNP